MESTTILPLVKELVFIKRGDVRQSQLNLITSLINGSKEKKDILNQITVDLVTFTNTGHKYVRYNCLELLALIINGLGFNLDRASVAATFQSRLQQLILDRTLRIRKSAIKLSCIVIRLTLVARKEINKELLEEILHILSCDYSSTIRAHIIENIPFLDRNIFEKLLERTKDIDNEVRSVSWQKLGDLYFWKYTSSSRLLLFFLQGLHDKNGSVLSRVEKVISDWFSRVPNGSMLKAIQQFNLEKEEYGIHQLLFGLFRCQNYSLENDYQLEYISEAGTFLWLTYLEYVKQYKSVEDWEETADRFLPAIVQYCRVLDKNQLNQRVLGKLLRIAHYFDYSDEAGRRKLLKCLKSLLALPYTKEVIHKIIILVRHLFIDDEDESIHFIAAAIALDVRSWPEERQLLFFSVVLKNFTATKQMFETHRQLMTKGLTSQDDRLRYLAFKCWALCCVSLEPLAEQSSTKLFLLALAREKNEKIQRIIFQALFDSVLLFELPTSDQIFKALCDRYVNKAANIYSIKTRKILTLGFCKCYASGRYQDSLVLGQLMLKCSSNLFEPENTIRDLIWRFFDCFANDEISSIFDDAFKRVVVTLLLSKTTIEPLLIFYKRIVQDVMRLQQMSTFLIQQQLGKFTTASLAKNMLGHIEDWIANVSNSIKDEIIFNSTAALDKIQNEQVKQKLTEFITSISSSSSGATTTKRKRKLISERVDQWDQLGLSIASSGLPNKKPKIQSNVNMS